MSHGADPNRKDHRQAGFGNTPLMWSIANAQTEAAVSFTRRPDVDMNIRDLSNQTALHFSITKGYNHLDDLKRSKTPMGALIDALIQRAGKNADIINAQDKLGNTALHYAVIHRDVSLLDKLMRAGADVTITNNQGQKPLDLLDLGYAGARTVLSRMHATRYAMQPKEQWDRAAQAIETALKS